MGLNLDAGKLLDAGGNMANLVNLGSGTYLDSTAVSEDPDDPQKKIVAGGNYLIGVVDTSMGFAGTLGNLQQKLAWGSCQSLLGVRQVDEQPDQPVRGDRQRLSRDPVLPVEVTVEDESGHRTTTSRACSVREWKGGSQ